MNAPVKVAVFLVGLAVVFGAAIGIGSLFDPVAEPAAAHDSGDGAHETADDAGYGGTDDHAGQTPATSTDDSAEETPGGLMVSQAGYTFRLDDPAESPGRDVPVTFTIEGPDGPVTTYDAEHEKRLHLIAVRRDFSGFQHVHPELAADGTWSTQLDLSAGQWRLYADFKPTGADALTLGTDLAVAGEYRPAAPSAESRTAVVDGYTVTLTGDLTPGADSELVLSVSRDGEPVTDLEPYLGAYGHLVALRAGDLAYLHVHPDGMPGDGSTEAGPDVTFFAAVPSAGTYRLYLDFKHQGVVRTASFTLGTGAGADVPEATHEDSGDDHGH